VSPSGQCWSTAQSANSMHRTILKDMFPAGIERIFIDLADIPKPTGFVNDAYVKKVMDNMPDGLRYWQNDEGEDHIVNGTLGEGSTRSHLDMCKALGAIPILCLGHTEERTSWLSRNPIAHTTFLQQFCLSLAHYLRGLGFQQAHLEVFNEPKKCIPVNDYVQICIAMGKGFKQYKNFKVHIGSNDIEQDLDGYIQYLVKQLEVLKYADYYATHVLWPRQHNAGYIAKVNSIIKGTNLKQSVTEFSPDGDWDTFDELVNNGIEIYCILFVLRNDFFGDVFDDIYIFDKHKGPGIISYNEAKHLMLRAFNNKYYNKQLPLERENMLDKVYKVGSKGIVVKFIQKVLNEDMEIDIVPLVEDGLYGSKTKAAVEDYQKNYTLKVTGEVDTQTFKSMVMSEPDMFDGLLVDLLQA
jgi:hypothetical protein